MVDRAVLAKGIADVRDAVQRIREVLPARVEDFLADRTRREVVVLNLYVAVQQAISLAVHWISAEGRQVPTGYREAFFILAERSVVPRDLADRLAKATGLRNLIAHRYGVLDWGRIYEICASDLGDLVEFCRCLAEADERSRAP